MTRTRDPDPSARPATPARPLRPLRPLALLTALAALVATAVVLLPGVAGARTFTQRETVLAPSGSVAYTWSASPALGCASLGLCGLRGALTVEVQNAGVETGGGQPSVLTLQTTGTARTQGPAPGTSCVDSLNAAGAGLNLPLGRPLLPPFAQLSSGPSSGRCAGPLPSDLGRLILPVHRHGRVYDLRTDQTTTAGPFEVTLDSTLTLRPSLTGGGGGSSSSGSAFGGPAPATPPRVLEQVAVLDAVHPVEQTLQVSFSAAPEPFCLGLGNCGASGTITLTVGPPARPVTIDATELVRHRLSRAAVLRAVRAGRLTGGAQVTLPASVTESISSPGQPTCTDTAAVSLLLNLQVPSRSGTRLIDPSGDAIRTHCPGPLGSDAIPSAFSGGSLALGPLAGAALTTRSATLVLTRATGFADPAFHGRWSGHISLGLTQRSLRVTATRVGGRR